MGFCVPEQIRSRHKLYSDSSFQSQRVLQLDPALTPTEIDVGVFGLLQAIQEGNLTAFNRINDLIKLAELLDRLLEAN
jgi:hypothetical protein